MSRILSPAICLAWTDLANTFTSYDLAKLCAHTAAAKPNMPLAVYVATGSTVPQQREILAETVIAKGHSHGFWVDSDMRFPKTALVDLLAHDAPMVGANYVSRHAPFNPTAIKDVETDERAFTAIDSTGLEPVAAMGFGCVLTSRDALEAIERPRFTYGWNISQQRHIIEDTFFCWKLAQVGIPIAIDHDLSKQVSHLGMREYVHTDASQPVVKLMA